MTAKAEDREDLAAEDAERRPPRWTLWAALVAACCLVGWVEYVGLHVRVGFGLPGWLGYVAGAVASWLVVAGLAWWAAELLKTHHRAMASAAWRGGRSGAVWTGARARHHSGRLYAVASGWAGPRWAGRNGAGQDGAGQGGDSDGGGAAGTVAAVRPSPVTVIVRTDPAGAPAAAATQRNGDRTMATGTPAVTSPAQVQRDAPAAWKALAADTGDFEAATDAELLDWMLGEVAGMLAYGEAVADVHEHHVSAAVRLDPAAMAALHDVADAVADAAEAMARARERYREVYEAPTGFVVDGGVLPKDGDFITGEGDE
jgi:hypothetical protein